MSNVTQFSADFTQLTLSKKTKIVLEVPEGTPFSKIAEIAQHRGERILVQFGNPQMSMEFKPQESGRPGLVATVDGSGVVESVKPADDAGDADDSDEQDDLFPQDQDGEDQGAEDEDSVEFGGDDDDSDEGDPDSEEEDGEPPIDREKLEEFIMNEQPHFEDIQFNFPMLLHLRRNHGKTWMELARELGVPSSRLHAAYQQYKKRVARLMAESGVA